MAAISNSVVHLNFRFDETELAIGTGFLYESNGEYFIVTAWHNLTGRHPETFKSQCKFGGVPNNVLVAISMVYPDYGSTKLTIALPLVDGNKSLFYTHPSSWPMVDVAVIPFDPDAVHIMEGYIGNEKVKTNISLKMNTHNGGRTEVCPIQKYYVPNKAVIKKWLDSVYVTEELFIPGYPKNIHDYYMQPIWKRATIASSVQHGWNREKKFLIDSASISGMSGSPVVYYSSKGVVQIAGDRYIYSHDVAILAGVYVGRLGVEENSDPQIGIVWHQSVIDEIIQGRRFEKLSEDIEVSNQELSESVIRALGSCSKDGLKNVNDSEVPLRHYVVRKVLEDVNGHVSYERALEAVLEEAKHYSGPFAPDR